MAQKPSDHLYRLVQTLSKSEWTTIRMNREGIYFTSRKGLENESRVYDLMDVLKNARAYNEPDIRVELGLGEDQKGKKTFKNIKQEAEKIIKLAIERAPANQSEKWELEKLPFYLQRLEERGIYYRVDRELNKYLPVARRLELWEVEEKLLQIRRNSVNRTFAGSEREAELRKIFLRVREIRQLFDASFQIEELRERFRLVINEQFDHQMEALREIYEEVCAFENPGNSHRVGITLDHLRYVLSIYFTPQEDQIAEIDRFIDRYTNWNSSIDSTQFFEMIFHAHWTKYLILVRMGRWDHAAACDQQIQGIYRRTTSARQMTIHPRIANGHLFMARKKRSSPEVLALTKKAWQTFNELRIDKENRPFLTYSFTAAISLIASGHFSEAVRWLQFHIGSRPRPIAPVYTLLGNVLMAIVRYEMADIEELHREVRSATRYCRKYHPESEILLALLAELHQETKGRRANLAELKEKFEQTTPHPNDINYLGFFDFPVWINARIQGKTMIEIED